MEPLNRKESFELIQKLFGAAKTITIAAPFGDGALAQLAQAGFDPVYGARPLKRAIQQSIENPLAKLILEGKFAPKDTIRVEYRGGAMQFEKAGARLSQKAATR